MHKPCVLLKIKTHILSLTKGAFLALIKFSYSATSILILARSTKHQIVTMKVTFHVGPNIHMSHVFSAESKNPSHASSSLIKTSEEYVNLFSD